MKKTLKNIKYGICILVCSFGLVVNATAQQTDFTGDWKVNLEKSDFGSLPKNYAASEFKITQDHNTIKLERILKFRDSTTTSSEILNFDGTITATDFKIKKKEARIEWSPEKTTLIETANQIFTNNDGTNGQYQSIETFKLSDDKSLLFYTRQVKSNKVNFTLKAVYQKK